MVPPFSFDQGLPTGEGDGAFEQGSGITTVANIANPRAISLLPMTPPTKTHSRTVWFRCRFSVHNRGRLVVLAIIVLQRTRGLFRCTVCKFENYTHRKPSFLLPRYASWRVRARYCGVFFQMWRRLPKKTQESVDRTFLRERFASFTIILQRHHKIEVNMSTQKVQICEMN